MATVFRAIYIYISIYLYIYRVTAPWRLYSERASRSGILTGSEASHSPTLVITPTSASNGGTPVVCSLLSRDTYGTSKLS